MSRIPKLSKLNLPAAGALGTLLAAALTVLLCLPGALLTDRLVLPLSAAEPWALASAGLGVCLSALLSGRLRKRQALPLAGLIAGGTLLLAALLCTLAGERADFGPWLWKLALAAAAGGLLGAVSAVRQNPHHRRSGRWSM